MTLDAKTYFSHLRAYLNDDYVTYYDTDGEVVLKEKYYSQTSEKQKIRRLRLLIPGPGLVFKLDFDKTKTKPPLFHFLDNNAKPWSKRCDFVIFYVNRRMLFADCIEFKSGSIAGNTVKEQLEAGTHWVMSLKRTIEYYTEDKRRIRMRKFLFGHMADANAYLNSDQQLNADPSIRYYHFDDVQGKHLDHLQNASCKEI